jgi:hypothetical protein
VASYPFLSPQWIEAARALRDEFVDLVAPSMVEARINVVVTDIPHGDRPTLEGHIDAGGGRTAIDHGHLDDPELTITVDYPTAKAAFVTRDQQELMYAFLSGRILVDGDATKLLALQAQPSADLDPTAVEMYRRLEELTADEL